ncbi:tol-pal system protein YbgF [Cognatishimia activa]|uniref:Cell division coordinator CpoB n=1 Tax=Cognatishimia activa TaxID=1715691 RepID=A0A0N7MBW5_9RHOB|nr:tol-pal system protein YbgF [Cognatishimia activa]CUI69784.1 tol-pal system protein YbgF [Cognatishimia activa]CUK26544.1 tol-pal system protein YbgF [Cognatishimia activa]
MRALALVVALMGFVSPLSVAAQSEETLADIRQQLSVLYVEVQRLKRELSTTGAPQGSVSGGSVLTRLDAIEAEMQRLTGKTEQLEFRVNEIVRDGTNRIGDLEFRLVELEGGDLSQLGETTTLGGDFGEQVPSANPTPSENTELAVGEQADFERAFAALEGQEFRVAADQFAAFTQTYPGSPLEAEAHLRRGEALEGAGEMPNAARAYLESYSGYPQSRVAPEALYRLGSALGKLGQTSEACVTLNEVEIRHPGHEFAAEAKSQMQSLGCS